MKIRSFIKNSLIALSVFGLVSAVSAGSAQAAQIPYVPGEPLPSPSTPAFNIYTNVPVGVGNEADFVRLRRSTGDPTVPAASSNYSDPLNTTCAVGDMFDVRTYVHNGASEEANDNGNGTAVAHNVRVAMAAQLNVEKKNFTFTSTVSASNAASVTDTGNLNCNTNVRLEFVPQTVKVYSKFTGWQSAPDSAVNGNLPIGSRHVGNGDVWGCWEDTVVVVYTVRVKALPTPPPPVPPTPTPTPPVPTTLPNTGAGGMAAIFTAVSAGGAMAYRTVVARRLGRD